MACTRRKVFFFKANTQIYEDNIIKTPDNLQPFYTPKFLEDVLTLGRVTTLLEVCLSCRRVHLGHILIRELSALEQSFSSRKVFILEQCLSQ